MKTPKSAEISAEVSHRFAELFALAKRIEVTRADLEAAYRVWRQQLEEARPAEISARHLRPLRLLEIKEISRLT